VQEAGVIDEIAWLVNNANSISPIEFYVNGVVQQTVTITSGTFVASPGRARFPTPISVAQGDRIAIKTTNNLGETIVQARVRNTTPGYMVQYGGNVTVNNAYYEVGDIFSGGASQTVPDTDHVFVLSGSGNLVQIAYAIEGAIVSDSVEIYLNGALDQVVPLTNGTAVVLGVLTGIETLTGSFSDGDTLAVRAIQSTMDRSVVAVLTDVAGHCHQFKGNPGIRQFFRAWGNGDGDAGHNPNDNDARIHIRTCGRVYVTWNTQNTPTGLLIITKNTNQTHTFENWTSGQQGSAALPLTVKPGDILGLSSSNGAEGLSNLSVVIR
jgi:hypothetical protein